MKAPKFFKARRLGPDLSLFPKHYWRIWRQWRSDPFRRRSSIAEVMVIVLSGVLAIIGAVQARIYQQQKRIMEAPNTQTGELIKAAKLNACAAAKIAEASKRNATAAESFATNAGLIKTGIDNAVNRLDTQAKATQQTATAAAKGAQTALDTLHISQRAYVVTGAPVLKLDTDIVEIPVSNTGHIPSGSLTIVVHEATLEVDPIAAPGITQPTEQHWQHYNMRPLPSSNNTNYVIDTPVQAVVASKINSGHQQIIIAGSITYNDGFPDTPEQTWLFCSAGLYFAKMQAMQWTSCDPDAYIKQMSVGDHYPKDEYDGTPYHRNPN